MSAPRNAVQTDRGRMYRWGDESFVSVTTLLGVIDKPALKSWAAKSVAEFVADNIDQVAAIARKDKTAAVDLMKGSPWRARDKAADLGTAVHDAIEGYILGRPQPPAASELKARMEQFHRFVAEYRPTFEMAEATVFSRRYGYAGTLDSIAVVHTLQIGTVRLLIDVKSGKDVYSEAALQLACYRYADFIGMRDGTEAPVPEVDGAAVLHITDHDYRLLPVVCDEEMWTSAMYALALYRHQNGQAKTCIGAPLSPAPAEARPSFPPNREALVQ